MSEKLPQMNSENTVLKVVLIICPDQAIVKPLTHGLDLLSLCKAVLTLQVLWALQDRSRIFHL